MSAIIQQADDTNLCLLMQQQPSSWRSTQHASGAAGHMLTWMYGMSPSFLRSTSVMEMPVEPARPVRPLRWMYVCGRVG